MFVDKTVEISRKHGNTLIATLRKAYGNDFAPGCADNEKLGVALGKMDEPSLSRLCHDQEFAVLDEVCRA
jgi:hypothetical protein